MKQTVTALVCILICIAATAQKKFEGTITYKLHASSEDKPDAELKILFGANAMKFRFKEKETYDRNELLVLFDSAAQYNLSTESSTYKKKALALKQPAAFVKNKTIAGYSTSGVAQETSNLAQLMGGLMMMGNSTFYVADSLYYAIPAQFGPNPVFAAVQNNKIVLAAEIIMQAGMYEIPDTVKAKTVITAEAVEITPMHFADSVFKIPAGYTDSKYAVEELAVDSAAVAVDTVVTTKPVKKTVKKPAKPAGKKTGSQPAATRRKQ